MTIEVPDEFARSTIDREGEAGRRWIEALPDLASELLDAWGLSVRGDAMHGYAAVVLPVARGDEPLALKVGWIDDSSRQEALVLRHWDGDGAVRLIDADEERGAVLLEWLDPESTLSSIPPDDATKIASGLLRRLAVPAPDALATVEAEVRELSSGLRDRWDAVGRPFREGLVEEAEEVCRSGAGGTGIIVNRDLHYDNVLAGDREPWLVIDPKALAGPLEFGVAQLLWNRFEDLGNRRGLARRIDIVTDAAGLDRQAAVRWSRVRLLDYWIWALEEGLDDDPPRCEILMGWLQGRL